MRNIQVSNPNKRTFHVLFTLYSHVSMTWYPPVDLKRGKLNEKVGLSYLFSDELSLECIPVGSHAR